MGGACGAYGGGESSAQGSSGEKGRGRDQWVDPNVDGRIILRWNFGKWEGLETGRSWLG